MEAKFKKGDKVKYIIGVKPCIIAEEGYNE